MASNVHHIIVVCSNCSSVELGAKTKIQALTVATVPPIDMAEKEIKFTLCQYRFNIAGKVKTISRR